jgi:hypothetical protein
MEIPVNSGGFGPDAWNAIIRTPAGSDCASPTLFHHSDTEALRLVIL